MRSGIQRLNALKAISADVYVSQSLSGQLPQGQNVVDLVKGQTEPLKLVKGRQPLHPLDPIA